MARSAKSRTDKAANPAKTGAVDDIPDAEIVQETPPVQHSATPEDVAADGGAVVVDDTTPEQETVSEAAHEAEASTAGPDSPVEGPSEAGPVQEPEPAVEESKPEPEPVVTGDTEAPTTTEETRVSAPEPEPARAVPPPPQAAPAPPPPPQQVTVRKVGFVPLVLGGVVAAAVGFAAGWQGLLPSRPDSAAQAALQDQAARIEELSARVAAIPAPEPAPDLAPLQDEIVRLQEGLAPLADRIAALEARLDAVERAPANDGTLSATAIAAWQQDIEDLKAAVAAQAEQSATLTQAVADRDAQMATLQATMESQAAEMARMADEAAQRLDAAQSTVAGIEEQANANATATLRRAVLASLQTAVDGGQPYAGLLDELAGTGVAVPDGLAAAAADGVVTLAVLTETFPDAARAALAAARAEGLADDGGGGVMAFLRSQLDVRSVEPREGSDPDAILSRAEAALREGRLNDSLAEIAALPEVVRAPMTDWIAAAEARVAALSALQSLAETLPAPATSN